MLLLKLGIFDITFGTIFTFVFGIAIGLAIVTIIYLIFVLKSLNSDDFIKHTTVKIEDLELKPEMSKKERIKILEKNKMNQNSYDSAMLILKYMDIFKDKKLRGKMGNFEYMSRLSLSLTENIASIYHPKSLKPMLEANFYDATKTIRYITSEVDTILSYGGLKFIRRFKAITIKNSLTLKTRIDDSSIMQASKKYHFKDILFGFKVLLNIINPIYWVRKAVVNTSFRIVSKKLCLSILQLVGHEAYVVYSKKMDENEKEMDLIEE